MNKESVADSAGFVYEQPRGPKRTVEFELRSDSGFERSGG